jgi:hypothetical protein
VHQNQRSIVASATTDAAGRYRAVVPFTINTTMYAASGQTAAYHGSVSGLVTAHIRASLIRLVNSSTAYVNQWWRIDGQAFPARMWTAIGNSFGYSAADGTFTRWWKPTTTGTFDIEITITTNQVDGVPIIRHKTVTVLSKQTQPTYLSAVVGPTSDPVPVIGSQMSTYGHLKVRYTNGTVGPFANQYISLEARQLTNPIGSWENLAGVKTTSTGYFYMNWNIGYADDLEIRVVYTSPYVTIKSALLTLGVVDVQ